MRGLFSQDEMVKITDCVEKSEDIKKYSYGREDSKGRLSKMCMWNYAGNDILGIVARSQKVAGTAQDLMGGDEVYHYHSKVCRWLNYFELIAWMYVLSAHDEGSKDWRGMELAPGAVE